VNKGHKSKGRVLLRASSERTILVSDRTLGHARALRGSLASAYASCFKEEVGAPGGSGMKPSSTSQGERSVRPGGIGAQKEEERRWNERSWPLWMVLTN
jgi:hypothetical protein